MAISANTFLNPQGGIDYEALQRAVQQTASRIGTVGGPRVTATAQPGTMQVRHYLPSWWHTTAALNPTWDWAEYIRPRQISTGTTPRVTPEGNVELPRSLRDLWLASLPSWTQQAFAQGMSGRLQGPGGERYQVFGTRPQGPSGAEEGIYQALIRDYQSEREAMERQAETAAEAMRLRGATTEQRLRGVEEAQAQAAEQYGNASAAWQAAVDKADEYVKESRQRGLATLQRLDEVNRSIAEGRDFAKAHDLQAAAYAVAGTLGAAERQTAERYGVDSAEFRQIRAQKQQALAAAQSGIVGAYRKLAEQQNLAYMNATTEAQWKADMYTSFQEQQHVETMRYMAQAAQQYSLQLAQFNLAAEQLKGTALENLAVAMEEAPSFKVDVAPLMTAISDLLFP